ncbi:hypothetical protein [Flavobacterium cupreum]|nr:hypothetical protein [Flavobacterium cupreum]
MSIVTFPVVETTGYIPNIARENIACGFNRRTTSISLSIIDLVSGLLKMPIDTFPVVETTGYIPNIAREKYCLRFQPHDDNYFP